MPATNKDLHKSLMDLTGVLNSSVLADRLLSTAGVSLDHALFRLLVRIEHRKVVGVAELAKEVGRDPTTVSRQVAKLESLGLIYRRPAEADRRVREANVTAEGHRLVAVLEQGRAKLLKHVLSEWSRDDQQQVTRLTQRLADTLLRFVETSSDI